MIRTLQVAIVLVLSLASLCAFPNSVDVGLSMGIGVLTGPDEMMDHEVSGTIPIAIKIGYSFGQFRVSLEGLIGGQMNDYYTDTAGVMGMLSLIGEYDYFSMDRIHAYVLLGGGFGAAYYNGPDWESTTGSGPGQFHVGLGAGLIVLDWMELFTESRLRVGFPGSPEVVTLFQQFGVLFRI